MCGGGDAPPTAARLFPGYARGFGLSPSAFWAKVRTKGVAQKCKGSATVGHSHRLTSGGKAEAVYAKSACTELNPRANFDI